MRKATGAAIVLALAWTLIGCQKEKTDEDLIREAVLNSEYFGSRSIEGRPGSFTAMDSLDYWTWWRDQITHPDPNLEIYRVEDSAHVIFSGKSIGTFHILTWTQGEKTKPFGDSATIEGIVKKNDAGEWEVTDVSGVHAISHANPPDYTIDSIWVKIGPNERVFTDPLQMFPLSDVMVYTIGSGDTIKCRVYASTMGLDGALHIIGQNEHNRLDFQDSSSYFYSQDTHGPAKQGVHFVAVDLFDKACLEHADTAYECRIWLIPFRAE
ncbi:MAG: hypothetical protein ABIM88_07475 [candidate division WOR-3 bacterium]